VGMPNSTADSQVLIVLNIFLQYDQVITILRI
jgi:hypothetical protein